MDTLLSSVTDIGLRRLYKFILKRVVGDYLESELLIEQLEVSSRTGLVTLTDLRLNCDVINDEHLGLNAPFKLVSFTIAKLEVTISYVAVLHDGCRFRASGVEVVMEPSAPTATPSSSSGSGQSDPHGRKAACNNRENMPSERHTHTPNEPPTAPSSTAALQSEEGQEGLNFIANWIEVVLSRLEVTVDDVRVILKGHARPAGGHPDGHRASSSSGNTSNSSGSSNSSNSNSRSSSDRNIGGSSRTDPDPEPPGVSLLFVLSQATFFNSNPRLPSNRASTVASSMRMTQSTMMAGAASVASGYASNKKVTERAVLCCAVLCCAVLCCAVLCCAVLCCDVM